MSTAYEIDVTTILNIKATIYKLSHSDKYCPILSVLNGSDLEDLYIEIISHIDQKSWKIFETDIFECFY